MQVATSRILRIPKFYSIQYNNKTYLHQHSVSPGQFTQFSVSTGGGVLQFMGNVLHPHKHYFAYHDNHHITYEIIFR